MDGQLDPIAVFLSETGVHALMVVDGKMRSPLTVDRRQYRLLPMPPQPASEPRDVQAKRRLFFFEEQTRGVR